PDTARAAGGKGATSSPATLTCIVREPAGADRTCRKTLPAVRPPSRIFPVFAPDRATLPDEMCHHLAVMGRPAMLEQVDSLPGSQRRTPRHHGYRQADRQQRCLDMRRHIVRPLAG